MPFALSPYEVANKAAHRIFSRLREEPTATEADRDSKLDPDWPPITPPILKDKNEIKKSKGGSQSQDLLRSAASGTFANC